MKLSSKQLAQGALIAALYALLTLAVQPVSSGLVQLRVSEALCVLPYFTPGAVPGLFLGCLAANLAVGALPLDVLFGSLATLVAAYLAYRMGRAGWSPFLLPLPAVVLNAAAVGWLLCYVYQVGVPLYLCMLYVGAGQALSCYVLGMPLFYVLRRYPRLF